MLFTLYPAQTSYLLHMDHHRHIKVAERLSKLLDEEFKIFGFKFGLDPIAGFIPVIGDFIPLILSSYIVWIGIQMRLPGNAIFQMIVNVILDFLIGLTPVVGDVSDFVFKSSTKNLAILKKHITRDVIEGEVVR